jgi:type VI secretion system secreted protein Hcp
MPSDYYLKLDGIKGESQAEDMKDNIELEGWSFGAGSPADITGKGLSGGKASFSDFSCQFRLDSASPKLLDALTKGTHIKEAVFTGRKSGGGGTPYKYLQVTMQPAYITSFSTTGGAEGTPTATMTLVFEEIQYEYFVQDTQTGKVTTVGTVKYDQKKAKTS